MLLLFVILSAALKIEGYGPCESTRLLSLPSIPCSDDSLAKFSLYLAECDLPHSAQARMTYDLHYTSSIMTLRLVRIVP